MKAKEIRDLSIHEAQVQLRDFQHKLFNIQLRRHVKAIAKPSVVQLLKRTIARLKTILQEKTSRSV
jgi:large subunit ribosomal protein L29